MKGVDLLQCFPFGVDLLGCTFGAIVLRGWLESVGVDESEWTVWTVWATFCCASICRENVH